MNTSRLEAFTDAVIAIVMTVLVLGLHNPDGNTFAALWEMRHAFIVYLVSFATLAVYWNSHHHLFQKAELVSGPILWWNMLLLFWISLFPFTTSWVGSDLLSPAAVITYGALMLVADVTWFMLTRALVRAHGKKSNIAVYVRDSKKSLLTIVVIGAGLLLSWLCPPLVVIACVISLLLWIVPDENIEIIRRVKKVRKNKVDKESNHVKAP